MKKLILLIGVFITALIFNSCSNNDNYDLQNLEKVDKIVGKWRQSQLFIDNIDQQIDECQKKMTIEVFENGTYIGKEFDYNDTQSECVFNKNIYGFWHNIGNSIYVMSFIDTQVFNVTFESNKIVAKYSEEIDGTIHSMKTIFTAESDVVPDLIIGKWSLNQEFFDNVEIILSECEKMGSIQFFEDGFFEEIDFEENNTKSGCNEIPIKTGLWKNIGNSMYYITNIKVDNPIKITFQNGKMYIEFTSEEDGGNHSLKLIFINYNS